MAERRENTNYGSDGISVCCLFPTVAPHHAKAVWQAEALQLTLPHRQNKSAALSRGASNKPNRQLVIRIETTDINDDVLHGLLIGQGLRKRRHLGSSHVARIRSAYAFAECLEMVE